MQIKQALTGYGRAEKAQIQQVVTTMLRLEKIPRPDDAADALAIALCHATVSRFGNLFKVNNMTRTKGNNTAAGKAFQQMISEQVKKEDRQAAVAAKAKKKTASKQPTPAGGLSRKQTAELSKKTGAGTGIKARPRLNTASEIARKIAAEMDSRSKPN